LSKEEHVDNEFLWNLKLLSEVHVYYTVCILIIVIVIIRICST